MSLGARGVGAGLCRIGGQRSSALPSCNEVMPVVGVQSSRMVAEV